MECGLSRAIVFVNKWFPVYCVCFTRKGTLDAWEHILIQQIVQLKACFSFIVIIFVLNRKKSDWRESIVRFLIPKCPG